MECRCICWLRYAQQWIHEALILQQLLEVVGQTDGVELDHAVMQMYARGVHISVHDTLAVQVIERAGKLSENGEFLTKAEVGLAELLPA